jgi:2,3-bisphosphoglycerate-independent phosphoglycerate mutase
MSLLFLFVDGIGVGETGENNPFTTHHWPGLSHLTGSKYLNSDSISVYEESHLFTLIDANLGVEGLPQSGTGQATLFSGINASKLIGKHFGPYPHTGIKHLLTEKSLFHQIQSLNKNPYFINAFPEIFFERSRLRNRWSCCTLMTKSAGLTINSVTEVQAGQAITAEIIQDYWVQHLGIDLPKINIEHASKRVAEVSSTYDLTLMEYYLTDKAGHEQHPDSAFLAIQRLDDFLVHYLNHKSDEQTLIITSDHGNIENLSVKTHTRNPVPFIAYGPHAFHFSKVSSIKDVTPAIISLFK